MKRARAVLGRLVLLGAVLALVALGLDVAYVAAGTRGEDPGDRSLNGLALLAPVTIARDARHVAHVRAANEHDMFFAQGYAEGSDRLFQLDLYRRFVQGTLGEVLGPLAAGADLKARIVDVARITTTTYERTPERERAALQAFADGVNAAMAHEPVPAEFRLLAYRPQPWKAQDSIAVGFATVLDLADKWSDVALRADIARELGPRALDAFFPLTDPRYDAPAIGGAIAPVAALPPLTVNHAAPAAAALTGDRERVAGSNQFAAGADRTTTGRALLANDPHLRLGIPGIWYLLDLAAPGFHAAGASLAGVPGVILGHNDRVAWGATNGNVSALTLYREHFRSATSDEYAAGASWLRAEHRVEHVNVRFAPAREHTYLRTRHGFVFEEAGEYRYAVQWSADLAPQNPLSAFAALDRARSIDDALGALAKYPGPTQNFVLADTYGNAAYQLAGAIPRDSAWGLQAFDGTQTGDAQHGTIPFAELPRLPADRSTLAFTANARMYAAGYPYRLAPTFAPPYRAYRIAELLRAKARLAPADFAAVQADVTSVAERELAAAVVAAAARLHPDDPQMKRLIAALSGFDGRFDQRSQAAAPITWVRRAAVARFAALHLAPETARRYTSAAINEGFVAVLRMLREQPRGYVPADDYDRFLIASAADALRAAAAQKADPFLVWRDAWRTTARHSLAGLGMGIWNGTPFPGEGGSYVPHVQAQGTSQSFRAVWDIGNWDEGGIVIPQGESGRPGSAHYRDLAADWIAQRLVPLPFSDVAVKRATKQTLTLTP